MLKEIEELNNDVKLAMGEHICKARIKKKIQSQEMAIILNMTQDIYSRIENGRQLCTTSNLYKIVQVLDASADYLIFGTSEEGYIVQVRTTHRTNDDYQKTSG